MATRDSAPPFVPLTREDVSDPALLPRRFDLLTSEVRDLAAAVRGQSAAFGQLTEAVREQTRYLMESNRQIHERIDSIEKALLPR